jgi:NAD(P)-dependent dehydrogenase (short-subunit alcohol dehydrogenase family)
MAQHNTDWLGPKDRVCVVTGAGSGIGRAVALGMADAGASVVLLDRDAASCEATAGLKHVPHGWRSVFATIMNERHPADQQVIDVMLAHAGGKGAVERLYNRSKHFDRARELTNEWADLLLAEAPDPWTLVGLSAPRGDNVVSLREVA